MLRQTTWNEIKSRYAGSVLGLAWLVLYPLLFLGVYSVFIYILVGVRQGAQGFEAASEQVLLIFCGLIPFFGFAEALSGGVASVTSNANLLQEHPLSHRTGSRQVGPGRPEQPGRGYDPAPAGPGGIWQADALGTRFSLDLGTPDSPVHGPGVDTFQPQCLFP